MLRLSQQNVTTKQWDHLVKRKNKEEEEKGREGGGGKGRIDGQSEIH